MVNGKQAISLMEQTAKYVQACGKRSILECKPQNIKGLNISELHFAPQLKNDVIQISKNTRKFITENNELFDFATPKPKFSIERINPDSFCLVHMTNFYPKEGEILSTHLATLGKDGIGASRSTIHFAINKSVTEHLVGNGWQTMNYAIITPFGETLKGIPKSKILGGIQDDFFFLDRVKLPKGSVIIKYNSEIPSGQLAVSEAFDGIKLIETSNNKLGDTANTVVKKLGYTTYNDAMKEFLGATEEEWQYLSSKPEAEILQAFENIEKLGGPKKFIEIQNKHKKLTEEYIKYYSKEDIKRIQDNYLEALKFAELTEKYSSKMRVFQQSWQEYCAKNGYINGLHSETSWFKSEMGICALDILKKLNKDSWIAKDFDGTTNLKHRILKSLDDAIVLLPKGKEPGIDIKKVKSIIEESEKPSEALQRLANELKIKAMPPKNKLPNNASDEIFPVSIMLEVLGI